MKLRLTQPGFETYNGQMGVTMFENGLSTTDVRVNDAIRMSAVMHCTWEDGTSPSISQALIDHAGTPAPHFAAGDAQHDRDAAAAAAAVAPAAPAHVYTEAELAAVADTAGIKGLRAIAGPLGIKGNAIGELIAAIVKATAPAPSEE